ncbi:MAG: O-acetyl-ADP-ribose deacetylase [Nitrospirae bacterium]|nr:O-acetyl-ADP-ribose deacetylase [Nitrospirota bacterium]
MGARIRIIRGDITTQAVDAIVNAANTSLLGGGGVDGAIHRAAGPELLAACRAIGGCPTGQARITPGFGLPARYIIHTVGPVWHGGGHGEAEQLAACYRASFALAAAHGLRRVALPAIGTGAYRYPLGAATAIAVAEARAALAARPELEEVRFVCLDGKTHDAYQSALRQGE